MPSNINVMYASLKCTLSGLQICRWQYGSIFIRFAVVASQICEITRNSENIRTYSSSRSSKVINLGANLKRICNFLLFINSNFGRISYCLFSRYRRIKLKIGCFPHPSLVWRLRSGGNSLEFLDETYLAKSRVMGLLYSENCMILTSTVFDWSTRVTDGRTDGRNCDSIIARSCCRLSRAKDTTMRNSLHTAAKQHQSSKRLHLDYTYNITEQLPLRE